MSTEAVPEKKEITSVDEVIEDDNSAELSAEILSGIAEGMPDNEEFGIAHTGKVRKLDQLVAIRQKILVMKPNIGKYRLQEFSELIYDYLEQFVRFIR